MLHLAMSESGAVPLIATTVYRSYWRACEAEAGAHYLTIQPDLSDFKFKLEAASSSLREREDHAAAAAIAAGAAQ